MDTKYKLSFTIYCIVQVFFMLYILMWSLGMSVNSQLNYKHYLLFTFVILNTLVIGFLPILAKKKNSIWKVAKFFGLLLLAINLFFGLNYLFQILFIGLDGGFFTITFLMMFSVAVSYLIYRIVKM